jgi:hypothetical protein
MGYFLYTLLMAKPDLISEFEYEGKVIVEWFDVFEKNKIPDLDWQQVYMIGNLDGKVPIVIYSSDGDNLPGGKIEHGETIEQAIMRESLEEINMNVVAWEPIGYQKLTRFGDSTPIYQFRVYAKLCKNGDFINDPAGSVIGHKLVELNDVNKYIKYGLVGDRLIANCTKFFNNQDM